PTFTAYAPVGAYLASAVAKRFGIPATRALALDNIAGLEKASKYVVTPAFAMAVAAATYEDIRLRGADLKTENQLGPGQFYQDPTRKYAWQQRFYKDLQSNLLKL